MPHMVYKHKKIITVKKFKRKLMFTLSSELPSLADPVF